jgi:transposase InsO family protein
MHEFRRPEVGNYMRWKGAVWVIRQNRLNTLLIQEHPDGETHKLAVRAWEQGCYDEKIVMIVSPTAELPQEKADLAKVSFSGLPLSMQKAVQRRRAYIEAFLYPVAFYEKWPNLEITERHIPRTRSRAKVVPLLRHVAQSMTPHDKVPGFTSFNGWLRDWQQYQDWTLMAPRFDRRGPDQRTVIVGKVKKVVEAAINKVFLTKNALPKLDVCEEVADKLKEWNKKRPESEHLSVSQRQIYRYIDDEVDIYDAAVARKGKAAADKLFKPVRQGPGSFHVMDIVEVDHTQAKTEVTHDETGESLGRPWVSAALDRCSRMVVGIHIHFEGQTTYASMQTLKNVAMPKGFLKKLVPEIDYEYPCCGNPVAYFFDRGADFISDQMISVGLNCDIRLDYAPGENPEYKGKIERFFRTLHESTALNLKGATPRIRSDGDHRAERSQATVTYSDFLERTWRFLTMDYAKDHHEGIGCSPLERWNERAALRMPRPPLSAAKLNQFLMLGILCRPGRKGVQWEGLRWRGDILKKIYTHPSFRTGKKAVILIDEADVSNAFVTDPFTGTLHPLEPYLEDYMLGTSLFLHRLVAKNLAKKAAGTHSEPALLATKAKLRNEALKSMSMKSTTSKTRARLARVLGMGSIAPAGDDLGSLDPRGSTPKQRAAKVKSVTKVSNKSSAAGSEADKPVQAAPVRPITTSFQLPDTDDE